tara:strand:+ start:1981 stop:2697 length:717 start_codon:yes stop_codon:yes gene_type:complete
MAYIGRGPVTGSFEKQTFTADGSTTTFTLNYTVGSSSALLVSVSGVLQEPEVAYNIASGGTTIVFTGAPESGETIFVVFLGVAYDAGTLLGTGAITGQTATTASAAADLFLTYDDSASALRKITNTNLTKTLDFSGQTELAEVANDSDLLLIFDASASAIKKIQKSNIATTISVNANLTGDGSTTAFTLGTSGRTQNNILVTVNGVVFHPSDDYTLSGTTLTFTTAPSDSAEIRVRYL